VAMKDITMTTEVEAATKTLNSLMDQREQLLGRSARLTSDRQALAYAAHTGDAKAKERLRKLNEESITHNAELESLDAAIAEATQRLATVKDAEVQQADRAQAAQLRDKLAKFKELGEVLDDCFVDFKSAAIEMKQVVDEIHRLGCATPDDQLYEVNCDLAFKTAVQGTPFWSQDFPALRSHERKTFRSLVAAWASSIEANIERRLGEQSRTTEAAA
jgi:chromosome segregation ATPase